MTRPKRRNDGGRNRRWCRWCRWYMVLASFLAMPVSQVEADGGVVVWTGTRSERPAAVVVSPPAPRVGVIEIAWVGPRDPAAEAIVRHAGGTRMRSGFVDARIDGEFKASFEIAVPGTWSVEIDPDGDGVAVPVRFDIVVGGPIPAWRSLWLPLFAWVPLVGVGLLAAWRRAV
ncbi:MAG: hypothetical protein CBB69_008585 [Phycisphaera sp. TMED9]|nr:MAG: hypothetical protein CBB69_008585 [Phycisphaera sp. TMED9]